MTAPAVARRLAGLGLVEASVVGLAEAAGRGGDGRDGSGEPPVPPLFSRRFVQVVARALDQGLISWRKASGVLGVPMEELAEVCAAHGVAAACGL